MNLTEIKQRLAGKKIWLIGGLLVAVVGSFLFSESFRNTMARRRALQKARQELEALTQDTELIRQKLARLANDSQAYEELVRKELGYLRPGEKEVRFLDK